MTTHEMQSSQERTEQTNPPVFRGVSTDLRTMVRYLLHARVVFRWNDDDGSQKAGRGQTRNISQKGAYVVSPERPPKGAHIYMNIYLPPLPGDTRVLSIEAEGQVLRVESDTEADNSARWGFAVSNHQVTLSTN